MQAIVKACQSGEIAGEVVCVIGPRDGAPALEIAASRGILTRVCPFDPAQPETSEDRLRQTLDEVKPDLILLAGYMRRLGRSLVQRYAGRIMNIHPGLIPSFCGEGMYGHHVHQAVIDSGVRYSGCTVHFVDEGYDTGPIIDQTIVAVQQDDTAESLAERILEQEHLLYSRCAQLFAQGRLRIEGRRVRILPEVASEAKAAR